jgi:hypothetical protein
VHELVLIVEDLAPGDLVHPRLIDVEFAQHLDQFVDVAAGRKVGR